VNNKVSDNANSFCRKVSHFDNYDVTEINIESLLFANANSFCRKVLHFDNYDVTEIKIESLLFARNKKLKPFV